MNFDFQEQDRARAGLESALAACRSAALIVRADDADPAYLFKHGMTQETAYQSLLRQDRRALHRLIADSCEQFFAADLDEYLALLAHHFTEAGETARAAHYWTRYGERAMQISAFPEAIHAFHHALDMLSAGSGPERARVYAQLGDVYCRRTDFDTAQGFFREALTSAIAANDAKTAATALSGIARIESQRGSHTRARELGLEALRWAQDAGDPAAIARAYRQLGVAYNVEGANELSETNLRAALDLYQQLRDREGIASCLNSLGVVARDNREFERAQECFTQALELSRALGDRYSVGVRLVNLGTLAEQRGDLDAAAQFQNDALVIANEIGDREGAALIRTNLGSLAQTLGNLDSARQEFRAALQECAALGAWALALYVIAAVAKLELARGELTLSAELLGLALYHPSASADIALDFQPVKDELQSRLPPPDFDAAVERGCRLDLHETVARLAAGMR